MPRAVPTLTGLLVAAAVAYNYQDELKTETADIRHRLNNVKSTMDEITSTVPKVNAANN